SSRSLDAVRLVGRLVDPRVDEVDFYFSPVEMERRLPAAQRGLVDGGAKALRAEAAAGARQGGVGMDVFVDVLAKGGAGGTALERVRPFLLDGDPSGLRFTIANALKDLGYYRTMAGDAGAAQAIAEAVQATLALGLARSDEQTLLPRLMDLLSPAERQPGSA
ncbi:MAG: NAD-binding protein, partial [Rubrivivax sp.]